MTNESQGSAVRQVTLGLVVYKTLAALASADIFTVYGRNLVTLLTGSVTVEGDGGATTIKLQTETNTIDLCAATTVTGDVVGTTYFLTGEVAVILNGTGNTPIVDVGANLTGFPSSPVILGRPATTDKIQLVQTGDDADLEIAWLLTYIPLDEGAYIEAA
jgi:hypothetical protein